MAHLLELLVYGGVVLIVLDELNDKRSIGDREKFGVLGNLHQPMLIAVMDPSHPASIHDWIH